MFDQEKPEMPEINADNGSTAVGSISVGGDINGILHIGNTTGYTADEVSALIAQKQSTFQPQPIDGRCPYKGLDVFEEEDAELFFGREKLVEDIVLRLKESRTVFITGPSGSGKSSLVRAGLIHALKQRKIPNSDRWLYVTMKPGRDPLESLANALSRLKSPELGNYFRQHVDQVKALHKCAESALTDNKNQRLVIFIDQFEEVFTQINNETERIVFFNLLTHAATVENGRVLILFSMRSDFVASCATYPQLNALLNQQFVQIGAMQPEELVSAIAQPALRVGLRIDPDLIAQIINVMKGEPGALPLMQFTLKDLFDSQQEKSGVPALTLNAFLQRGGIHKSLERHADDSFARLSKNEQELARSIFSGLIEIGRGTQDTKRTALFDELVPANTSATDVEAIVQKLADARLVTTDEQAGKDTVTISHEKLIDAWPWLKKLVNENRDVIALQNEITTDAKEWDENKFDTSYLYSGARLLNSLEQLKCKRLVLSSTARKFIQASRLRKQRNQLILISGVFTFFVLLIITMIVFRDQAQKNVEIAYTAQAASTEAVSQKAAALANAEEAQRQAEIALARQLAAQAQSLNAPNSSKQITAVLLATQSMKMIPSSEAAQVLLSNNYDTRLIAQMWHSNGVRLVALSLDGKRVVSGSSDGTIRVWELPTGTEIAQMTHDEMVMSVAFSPDSKYVISGSADNTARIWDAATGREITRMIHDDYVISVAFSPDGKYVVTGSGDKTVRLWDPTTGKEVVRMTHPDSVTSVAISPNGKLVVSVSFGRTALVWEAATGKEIARLNHDGIVNSIAFSLNGEYVVSGSTDRTARVWDATTGREIARMSHNENVLSVALSPDNEFVASGSIDGVIRLWKIENGKEVARMTHNSAVSSVAFSRDGKYVVSSSHDKTVRVWEVAIGKELARLAHLFPVDSAIFSQDGKYILSGTVGGALAWEVSSGKGVAYISNEDFGVMRGISMDGKYVLSTSNNTARVWTTETSKEIARMTHDDYVVSATFSPDSKYVVSSSRDGIARVWETATGKEIARLSYIDNSVAFTFSPDGKYIGTGGFDKTVRIWETTTGREVARLLHGSVIMSVAFSPDSKYLVSGEHGFIAHIWEVESGKEIDQMIHVGSFLSAFSAAFSPDGKYVVTSADRTAYVWEVSTNRVIANMSHDAYISSVAFSRDGKYIASGDNDNIARVWEALTGKEVTHVTHDLAVNAVAFSPDGKYIVSGSDDNTARVWEVATGREVISLTHDASVILVNFSLDGNYVVSLEGFNRARIWMWRPEDLIRNTCTYLLHNLTSLEWNQYIGNALPYQATCSNLPVEAEPTVTAMP